MIQDWPHGGPESRGMGESLNDAQVMHAMALDDMYHVQSVLA